MDGDTDKQQNNLCISAKSDSGLENLGSDLRIQDAKPEVGSKQASEKVEPASVNSTKESGSTIGFETEKSKLCDGNTEDSDFKLGADNYSNINRSKESTNSPCDISPGKGSIKDNNNKDPINDEKVDENMEVQDVETTESLTSLKEEKHEEDVPEDFFDDFLKEDFMAGLDIVDEDDEEQDEKNRGESRFKQHKRSMEEKGTATKDGKKGIKSKIDHVKKFRESPSEGKKLAKKIKKKSRTDELKKLNAELEQMRNAKPIKPLKSKSAVDADSFDIRRDPEKTRQAIQRDKIKSAKDKEKRLITDIVETGLVPPGMELEVDIEEVRRIERSEKKLPVGDLRERLRSRKSKSRSPDKIRSSVRKRTPPRNRTPLRNRTRTPPKRRKSKSPKRESVASSTTQPGMEPVADSDKKKSRTRRSRDRSTARRSPLKRSPRTHLSPLTRRSPLSRRSPLYRRSPVVRSSPIMRRSPLIRRSPVANRRSPTLRRRTRSRSITRRRSRSRSPILHRRSRSRNRSPTYRRRRDRSYSPLERERRRRSRSPLRKEEKMSFLEELAVKLNESHPPQPTLPTPSQVTYVLPTPPQPIIAPVPAPVPAPQSAFFSAPAVPQLQPVHTQSAPQFDYDQSFFIGSSAPLPEREQLHLIQQASIIQRAPQSNGFSRNDADLNSSRDIAKLFGDTRIKLSDFLAITAKPQVNNSSPAKLQEKIKVIQRCQEAVKILNNRRFIGPLVVHKTDSIQSSKDMTVSPLLRKPVIQLPFTTPGLRKSNEIDFTKCCETLLYRIGIDKTLTPQKESEMPKVLPPKELPKKEIAPPVFPVMQNYSELSTPVKAITKTLSTQTDKELSSCKECLRRKGILYANCGVQVGDPTVTFSVSTQVNEADFYSMIPRNQSLASLTPAQLLGKQSMITDLSRMSRNLATHQDLSRTNFQVPSPPPPPVFHYMVPMANQTSQREAAPYPPSLFGQTSIPSLLPPRSNFGDDKNVFSDNRRGGFNKRRF